jgi:serine/threonine-protein kinase
VRVGDYKLLAMLGRGGMADVHLAMKSGPPGVDFRKLAVVKQIRASHEDDPEHVKMLVDEAAISARLSHPNLVQTFEVGLHDGRPFLAMEYLEGQSLSEFVREAAQAGRRVPVNAICLIIVDVLAGLDHAHELKDYDGSPLALVHRDLSPHNVFLTLDGHAKVLDFGIAKSMRSQAVTNHGVVKGKLRYMAPEQLRGKPLDRRADIFNVGIVLWECMTGRRIWSTLEQEEIVKKLARGTYPASPRSVCPDVPPEIDAICQKALAKSPHDRYSTAAEMRGELEAVLGDGAMAARHELVALVDELSRPMRAKIRDAIEAGTRNDIEVVIERRQGSVPDVPLPDPPVPNSPAMTAPATIALKPATDRSALKRAIVAATAGAFLALAVASAVFIKHDGGPRATHTASEGVTPQEPLSIEPVELAPPADWDPAPAVTIAGHRSAPRRSSVTTPTPAPSPRPLASTTRRLSVDKTDPWAPRP